MQNNLKDELRNYLRGNESTGQKNIVRTIRDYLRESQNASRKAQKSEFSKKQEVQILIQYLDKHNLWFTIPDPDTFFAEGAEQKVYLWAAQKAVIKVNSGVFYEFWIDYLDNLLLHNFFFNATEYQLLGFTKQDNEICAVVKQSFVESNQVTNLDHVKRFLEVNGFQNTKNNDYYHSQYDIILEDLHDENVLTYNDTLFFIDTVFYLK